MMNSSYRHLRVSAILGMLLAISATTPAVAALYTINWQATVGTITGPIRTGVPVEDYLSAGHSIKATGVFDDTSTEMHDFDSGGNIIATYSTSDPYYAPNFNILDDVDYTFSQNLQDLINATDKTLGNFYFSAYFHDIHNLSQPYHSSKYRDPGIDIWFSGASGSTSNMGHVMWAINGTTSAPSNLNEFFGFDLLNVTVTVTPLSSEPVPEPMTLLLFATGLAGLAGSKLKRKKEV